MWADTVLGGTAKRRSALDFLGSHASRPATYGIALRRYPVIPSDRDSSTFGGGPSGWRRGATPCARGGAAEQQSHWGLRDSP